MFETLRRAARSIPGAAIAYRHLSDALFPDARRRQRFRHYYTTNYWRTTESRSGPGSTLDETSVVREVLPILCREFAIASILDLPCGDLNWMQQIDLAGTKYIGGDIVPQMIIANREKFADSDRDFILIDIVRQVPPRADLVLCRDLLVHLTFDDIKSALGNLRRSGARWLLTTTFEDRDRNDELHSDWRTLNFRLPPFSFPPPVRLINENCSLEKGQYKDKCLGLWRLEQLDAQST